MFNTVVYSEKKRLDPHLDKKNIFTRLVFFLFVVKLVELRITPKLILFHYIHYLINVFYVG